MKKSMICGFWAVCGLLFGLSGIGATVNAADTAAPFERAVSRPSDIQQISRIPCSVHEGKTIAPTTNCGYYYYYGYYQPVVYYRPVCYYTYTYPCYYTYSYVTFYNGMNDNVSNGNKGFLMEKTPDAGTPLAKLGVKKGDIITKIDGKPLHSVSDMDNVNEHSDLTVLKTTAAPVRSGEATRSTSDTLPLSKLFSDM